MTTSPTMLNALHACREGHPWNTPGKNHWFNAYYLAQGRMEISYAAKDWLMDKAEYWDLTNS